MESKAERHRTTCEHFFEKLYEYYELMSGSERKFVDGVNAYFKAMNKVTDSQAKILLIIANRYRGIEHAKD